MMEREWEKTFDAVPDLIAILNNDFEIVRINRAMAARLGNTPQQCIGKKCHQLVHGQDEPPSFCPHARLVATGSSHAEEVCEPKLNGTFLVTTSPLRDQNGRLIGSVHVARDISDRKRIEKELDLYRMQLEELVAARTADLQETNLRLQDEIAERRLAEERLRESETRYRIVADNTYDWEYWLDHEGAFVYSSPSCLRITGWDPEAFMEDSELFCRIIHPDDRPLMKRHWQEYQYREKDWKHEEIEFRIIRRDRKVEWIGHVCQPVFDDQGNILGVRASNRNITERKEAQEEKSRLEVQLRRSKKLEAIGTLAGGIAHDFNNILGAISGYTEMALAKLPPTDDARIRRYLQHVYEGAGRAKELVRQILAFSRHGERRVKPVPVTLIVREAIKLIRAILPATIKIRQKIKASADIVLADPTQIHQVVMNLLTNAFHAMGEQGGRLDIELFNEDLFATKQVLSEELSAGSYLVLRVKDSGQGMAPEVMERIFDPFFSTKKSGEGTGLGLSVVHGIVRSCGGGIQVESNCGAGTEFRIYFPVSMQKRAEIEEISEPLLPGGAERVLFVDDDPVLVELGQDMLTELGYLVTALTDSREALNAFRETPDGFDLVITDQTMPGLTGYELTKKIRKIRPGIPVILCTGFSESVTPERTRALGISEVILKPLVMQAMSEKIHKVLDTAKLRKTKTNPGKKDK
ncbi:MAG: PAS domain S-box protein [Syntrophales bacterium]